MDTPNPAILEVDLPETVKCAVEQVLRSGGFQVAATAARAVTGEDLVSLSWDVQHALNQSVAVHERLFAPSWRSFVPIPGIYKSHDYDFLYTELKSIIDSLAVADDTADHLMKQKAREERAGVPQRASGLFRYVTR